MNKVCLFIVLMLALPLSGCFAYKNTDVTLSSSEVQAEQKYGNLDVPRYFISWEPYHFFLSLGILPQYVYQFDGIKMNDDGSVSAREHTRCIGWLAIPLSLFPDWHYGENPETKRQRNPTNAS